MKKYFIILAVFTFVFFINFEKNSNNAPANIPISFSKYKFPIIQVDIEGKKYPLELSLISKYPLFIDAETINEIPKCQKGKAEWKNVKGEKKTSPLFQISNVKLGNLKLKKVLTASDPIEFKEQDSLGHFAWPFNKMNLVLDFPHHQIIGIKNKDDLIKLGYDVAKMEKVKCQINKKGIYFKAITRIGELNFVLETSSNFNVINSSFCKNADSLITKINIGNKDFGDIKMLPFKITQELETDGSLGVAFLKDHIIYIDAKNETLYIGDKFSNSIKTTSIEKISLEFTDGGLPVAEMEIHKKKYPMVIDLGSYFELVISSECYFPLDNLRKIETYSASINPLGNEQNVDSFILNECRIGNSLLKNIFVAKVERQGIDFGITEKKLGTVDSKQVGYLGRPLLHRTNLYFDFAAAGLWFIEQDSDLKKINVQLEEFEKIPFTIDKCGLVLSVRGDEGDMRLMLDTGATASMIKPEFYKETKPTTDSLGNPWFTSHTFVLGNSDFGETRFYSFDISDKFGGIDGILGMEFLREHPFYIDYPNRLIYFKKPSK